MVSSVAMASALTGSWRAFGMWSSEGWSDTGDGLLFWLTWSADPGGRRLLLAAALALAGLLLAFASQSNRLTALRPWSALVTFAAKPWVCAMCLALALLPQVIARVLAPSTSGKPTVVFILLDSIRLDYVGWGGSELNTTPRLDALAHAGAAFTQSISQASWTKPAVGSLMTSQVPSAHEATTRSTFLNPKMRAVGEAFAAGGYRTMALSSNPNITPDFGFAPGFQFFVHDATSTAEPLIATAKDWLAAAPDHASFLYLHLNDAHYPYDPAPQYTGLFNHTGVEAHLDGPAEEEFRNSQGTTFSTEQVESLRLSYAEEIRYLDDQVGVFVEELLASRNDILVVIVADHGEEFLDHGDLGHGHTLYDELIRAPLQFAWSPALGAQMGWSAGIHGEQVRHIDVLPTLLDVANLAWPDSAREMQGASLTPFFSNANALEGRPAFAETDHLGTALSGNAGALRCYRAEGYKMIVSALWQDLSPKRGWLFRLAADPGERNNIAADQLAIFGQLRARMFAEGWIVERDMSALNAVELSQAKEDELSAIGYATGGEMKGLMDSSYLAPHAVPWMELQD